MQKTQGREHKWNNEEKGFGLYTSFILSLSCLFILSFDPLPSGIHSSQSSLLDRSPSLSQPDKIAAQTMSAPVSDDKMPTVLIVGAGLGGLLLGALLERINIPYFIFERATKVKPLAVVGNKLLGTWKEKILRKIVLNYMPSWLEQRNYTKQAAYRPQITWMPFAENHGSGPVLAQKPSKRYQTEQAQAAKAGSTTTKAVLGNQEWPLTMKYLAAYLLLTIGGNAAPAAKDVSALLATVGIEAESERIESLIAQLAGKDINEVREKKTSYHGYRGRQTVGIFMGIDMKEKHLDNDLPQDCLIAEGTSKLASVPSGGAAAAPAAGGAAAATEAKAEEKKEEAKEESDDDMGFGLFD
ncbi:hypothetical protein KVV02_007265 [Mortierella alpina]|uniref:60S acidic ribosomal protein P2 n=1 Tax=Mortierella alpina TaxID=64518 RepID=A0A9P8CZ57_MORAP|nr:hypothetical protein KVV02_007265 [Mortierella alpina]